MSQLVLTRRAGEAIMIGTDVRVSVIEIRGGQARIAIEAPRAIEIHREEVFLRIKEENDRRMAQPNHGHED